MPLPSGVTAATLTVKATKTTRSSPIAISASIAPSVDLTHAASGVKLSAMIETLVSGPGLASKILVPHSSQAGFVDESGRAVSKWHYVATTTSRTLSGTLASAPRTKTFLLPAGTTAVELETLPMYSPPPADEPDIPESLLPPRLSPEALSATFAPKGAIAPALGHSITDPTEAHADRATLVSIPTYDGSGVVVHPCVYFNPDGWNGKKYWMAMTPYPSSQNQLENPSILCSDDGDTWTVPAGLTNPVVPPVTDPLGGYNSDPYLFVDRQGTMYLFWREYIYLTHERHVFKTSTNGVTWGPKTLVRQDVPTVRRIMSPAYIQLADSSWVMYGVDILPSPARTVVRSTAPTLTGPWTTPEIVTITGNAAVPWHLDVQRVGGEWQALVQSSVADGAGGDLWAMVSQDGLNWTAGPALIARGTPGTDWDASYYKSAFIPATRYGLAGWDTWVGGATFPASGQIVGRTFVAFDTTASQVAAAVAALPATASAKTQEVLAAKAGLPPWVAADTFARADGALTTSDSGHTWTASAGTFAIVGKGASPTAAGNTRATLPAVVDATATVELASPTGTQQWLIARFVDGSNYYRFGVASDGRLTFQRITAGAAASDTTVQATAPPSGSEITVKCSGSDFTLYLDGVQETVITDATHAGTAFGIQASVTAAKFRNFRVSTP